MKLKLCTALLTAATILAPLSVYAEKAQNPADAKRAAVAAYGRLPLSFEPTASAGRFVAHNGSYTISVGSRESAVAVTDAKSGKSQTLRFAFEKANPAAPLEALEVQPAATNYYLGNDSSKWRLGVKNYAKLRAVGVYPGVDVVYYGDHRRLEFDFVVAPKADPSAIALSFAGMDKLYKDANGDVVAELNGKSVRFGKPYAYQKVEGVSKPVEVDYEVATAGNVQLHIGDYDKNSELIIDPVVSWVTYLGGIEGDTGNAIAVDTTGAAPGVFVTGETCSADFPETTPASPNPSGYTFQGVCDAYITKLSLDGTTLSYTTILGGSTPSNAFATGNGIAVDASDQAYVAGTTNIADLPGTIAPTNPLTSPHSYQGGDSDAFIVILKANGTLLRITYLGGKYADSANGIAIDQATPPNVIVVGQTASPDFPGYSAFETQIENYVAFVTKLDNDLDIASPKLSSGSPGYINPEVSAFAPAPSSADGETFFFSEFFNGQIQSVGPSATATWQPYTYFPQYTIVYDSLQPAHSQIALNSGCSGEYSAPGDGANPIPNWNSTLYGQTPDLGTTCGGPTSGPITWEDLGPDVIPVYHTTTAYGVAVDPPGDVFVVGGTDTPTLAPYSHYTGSGAWVLKVSGVDGSYIYGTALETTASSLNGTIDTARAIAVDSQGRAYVTGTVTGGLLASSNSYQPSAAGGTDAFLLRVNTSGSNIDYASYLGGSGNDQGLGVAVDAGGDGYITGRTQSTNFPTVNPLVNPSTSNLMTTLSGSMNAFISEFSADGSTLTFSTYLGGADTDQGNAIALDQSKGDMYLAGTTTSLNLESLNPPAGYTAPQVYGGNGDAFVSKVAVSGTGIAGLATISLSPASLAFGNQTVGQSASLAVTLTNSSTTAVLTISQILPSGSSDFTVDSSVCPISLAAGKSCTITVTFLPTSAASESASFSVSGSATNSPQTVAITGTGVPVGSSSGSGSSGSTDFNVTTSASAVQVTQGDTAVYSFSVAPINGYTGSVAFTCSGPTGSSCSVTPNPVTMDGTTVPTVKVYVNTTGGSGSMTAFRSGARSIFLALLPFSMMGMLLINKRRGYWFVLLLVLLCLLLGLASCGGSGGSSSGGLAPGTYQVVVSATSNGSTQTSTLSLVITKQ